MKKFLFFVQNSIAVGTLLAMPQNENPIGSCIPEIEWQRRHQEIEEFLEHAHDRFRKLLQPLTFQERATILSTEAFDLFRKYDANAAKHFQEIAEMIGRPFGSIAAMIVDRLHFSNYYHHVLSIEQHTYEELAMMLSQFEGAEEYLDFDAICALVECTISHLEDASHVPFHERVGQFSALEDLSNEVLVPHVAPLSYDRNEDLRRSPYAILCAGPNAAIHIADCAVRSPEERRPLHFVDLSSYVWGKLRTTAQELYLPEDLIRVERKSAQDYCATQQDESLSGLWMHHVGTFLHRSPDLLQNIRRIIRPAGHVVFSAHLYDDVPWCDGDALRQIDAIREKNEDLSNVRNEEFLRALHEVLVDHGNGEWRAQVGTQTQDGRFLQGIKDPYDDEKYLATFVFTRSPL